MLYLYAGIFMLLITGFVATTLVLARLLSPGRRSGTKNQIYETGETTVTDPGGLSRCATTFSRCSS
jgi:NADH-quinone oxidoreductase subunit A